MNRPILAAAVLMILTLFVHVFAGGPEIHQLIQTSALPTGLRAVSAVLWHAVSVNLLVFSVALLWLAKHPNPPLGLTISFIQLGWAALFLYYGASMLATVWLMPQWLIFLTIPALTFWGQWPKRSNSQAPKA